MPILKITKGKLGVKTKKKDDDDEGAQDKSKMQQREIKGMEEMHWKVYFKIQELQKAQDNLDKATTARTAYMNSQNLVAVDGKEPLMTPQQREKVQLLNSAIKVARDARDKLLEEGETETSPSGFTMGPVKTTPVKTTKE